MTSGITFGPVAANDFEVLVALRIEVMRESLERIGRFDLQRSRERFRSTFRPADTRRILLDGAAAGCVATWREAQAAWRVEHFYLAPAYQDRGLGSAVITLLIQGVPADILTVRVGALKESAANRFYRRHGFVQVAESEFDIEYERPAR